MRHRLRVAFAAGALAALTAGCGSSAPGASSPSSSSPPPAGQSAAPLISISVGNLAVAPSAPLVVGMRQGFFRQAGLKVTIVPTQAASMIPSVLSNRLQFAFLNPPAILIARSHQVPVEGVATAARYDPNPDNSYIWLLVKKNGPIHTPAGLAGKTVAVDTLDQVPHLSIMNALRHAGVNPATVKYTEVPFPSMASALASGRVAGVVAAEPFVTVVEKAGGRKLLAASSGMPTGMPSSEWFSASAYVTSHPGVVAKFVSAIDRSMTYAQAHPQAVRTAVTSYTKIPPALAKVMQLPNFVPGQNEKYWQAWYGILKTEGLVHGTPSLSSAYYHGS